MIISDNKYYFLQVQLLTGWQEPLLYQVDKDRVTPDRLIIFSKGILLAQCPFRSKKQIGLVKKIMPILDPLPNFVIKEIISFIDLPQNESWVLFINEIESLFATDKAFLLRRLLPFLCQPKRVNKKQLKYTQTQNSISPTNAPQVVLSPEQFSVAQQICELTKTERFAPTLLHGVTGSGKSQIYLEFIITLLQQGKSIIFLVPEISLAKNFLHFFQSRLPLVFAWHTTEDTKKEELWQAVVSETACLIVGVHQPIFLPLNNLGGIIIDEEHEASFMEQQPPYLDTKLLALLLAQKHNIPIILGSATPSVSSFYQAKENNWHYFQLKKRFAATVATVSLVELNYDHKPFWITKPLLEKLKQQLAKGEQSILYLNRRGFASTTKCRSCKQVFFCSNCSVSLVLHKVIKDSQESFFLECHYCGLVITSPFLCKCGSSSGTFHKGLGTEQVCQVLQKTFPAARILRADKLSMGKKDWATKINLFATGQYDVLVGTKTVTKGYHFPNVTFAAVLWADLDFSFPDYRATERALQQTLQLAGRSGRGDLAGEVIIQAFDVELLQTFSYEQNYKDFVEQELSLRKLLRYPPFSKLLFLQTEDIKEEIALKKITFWDQKLQKFFTQNVISAKLLGPAKPLVFRRNKLFLQQLMIKINNNKDLRKILCFLKKEQEKNNCTYWIEV